MDRIGFTVVSCLMLGVVLPAIGNPSLTLAEPMPRARPALPCTWAQFIQQGGNKTIQVDFDLPTEFRHGPVYFNTEKSQLTAFILKQGLQRYPPIQADALELNYEYLPLLERRKQVIMLRWEFSNSRRNDTTIRYPYGNRNVACLRQVCLLAPMLTRMQREQLLRSQRPIQPGRP